LYVRIPTKCLRVLSENSLVAGHVQVLPGESNPRCPPEEHFQEAVQRTTEQIRFAEKPWWKKLFGRTAT